MNTLFNGKRFYVDGKIYTFKFEDDLKNFIDYNIVLYGDSGDSIELPFDKLRRAKSVPGIMITAIGTTLVNGKWEDAAVFIKRDDILRGTIVKVWIQNTNVNPVDVKFVIGNPEYYYNMEELPEYYDIVKCCVEVEHVDIIPHMQPVYVIGNRDTKLEFINAPDYVIDLNRNYCDLSSETSLTVEQIPDPDYTISIGTAFTRYGLVNYMQFGDSIFIVRDHKVICQTKNINDVMPLDRYHYTMKLRSFDNDSVDIISSAIKTSISIFNHDRSINYNDIYHVVAKYIEDISENALNPFQIFNNIVGCDHKNIHNTSFIQNNNFMNMSNGLFTPYDQRFRKNM